MKERNFGIDLLKLVLMYMVCVLHTLGHGGILDASQNNMVVWSVFWFIEILSYCAVDGFALISGYNAVDKKHNYSKLVNIWFQVFFYSFFLTIVFTLIGLNKSIEPGEFIRGLFPITTGYFWYMTAYFGLFLTIPILNKFIFSIDEKTAKKALIIILFMFVILGVIVDPFNTAWGYSFLWLVVLYLIGALSKRIKLFENKKSITLILIWLFCILSTWFLYIYLDINRLVSYISPTIVLSAMIMVVLFSRLKIKGNLVSKLVKLSLGIYLFQLNEVIWNDVILGTFSFISSLNIFIGVLCALLIAFGIFVIGLVIECIRTKLFKLLKISKLSDKIVLLVERFINKAFMFIE